MKKPTPQEVTDYALSIGFKLDGGHFCDFYESKGWMVGKSPMKVWKAAVRTWKRAHPELCIKTPVEIAEQKAKELERYRK